MKSLTLCEYNADGFATSRLVLSLLTDGTLIVKVKDEDGYRHVTLAPQEAEKMREWLDD